jgi:hypothetical protein
MKNILILLISLLFIILPSCNSSSTDEKNNNQIDSIFSQETGNEKSGEDIFEGKVYSAGIPSSEDGKMGCDGITYSEYGIYLIFEKNNQVKAYSFNSSAMSFFESSVLSGTYEIGEDKLTLRMTNESAFKEENLTSDPMGGYTPTLQNPNKKINQIQTFNITVCNDKNALEPTDSEEGLVYVVIDEEFAKGAYAAMKVHAQKVQDLGSVKQSNSLPGTYISNEEGIQEMIYLEMDAERNWEVYYKSPKTKDRIKLNLKNVNKAQQSCEASFPNASKVFYKFAFSDDGKLTSTNTAGEVQNFAK